MSNANNSRISVAALTLLLVCSGTQYALAGMGSGGSTPAPSGYQNLPSLPGVVQPEILYADPSQAQQNQTGSVTPPSTEESQTPSAQTAGNGSSGSSADTGGNSDSENIYGNLPSILRQTAGTMNEQDILQQDEAPIPVVVAPNAIMQMQNSNAQDNEADNEEEEDKSTTSSGNKKDGSIEDIRVLLNSLGQPNAAPLTISQLAKINDTFQRLDYIAQVEKKLEDLSLGIPVSNQQTSSIISPSQGGVFSGGLNGPSGFSPTGDGGSSGEAANIATFSVIRLIGSHGKYSALIVHNGQQVMVNPGDTVDGITIRSIDMSGVQASTARSSRAEALSFAAPPVFSSVSAKSGMR